MKKSVLVTVDVPDQVANQFRSDETPLSRQLLEDFLLQRFAERKISSGVLGEALDLSFYETEQFLHDRCAPASITPEEHAKDMETLGRLRDRCG